MPNSMIAMVLTAICIKETCNLLNRAANCKDVANLSHLGNRFLTVSFRDICGSAVGIEAKKSIQDYRRPQAVTNQDAASTVIVRQDILNQIFG